MITLIVGGKQMLREMQKDVGQKPRCFATEKQAYISITP